jgi:hypothetical protein
MTTTIEAVVNGTAYNLTDATLVWSEGNSGLGMAPLHHITERGPLQHGVSYLGFRLDPRVIQLVFGMSPASQSALWTAREDLMQIFTPSTSPIIMRWTLDTGDVRQIDAVYSGRLDYPTADRNGFYQRSVVELVAHDPTFYNPVQTTLYWTISGGMSVPLDIPWAVGAVTSLTGSESVYYTGTWSALPVVRITGPITDPVVENVTTGEALDFTGTTIAAADYYEIDCRYGYKTVKNKAGTSKIADLLDTSDLATFHIAPAPEATNGVNSFEATGSATDVTTQIALQYYTRYIGI